MDRRRIVAMAGALALVVGIGAGAVQAADRDVAVSGFSFSPRTVTVNVGDTVTWTNSDAQTHTATSGSAWDTGNIANGQSKSITFRNAGTFDYICAIHPQMTGTVVVQGGAAPATDTALASEQKTDTIPTTLAILGLAALIGALIAERRFRTTRD
jgi:plastocyanin